MLVLGLQGSPRKKGNTSFLLSAFMKEAERLGALTHVIEVDKQNIVPCKEYIVCEKKGFCPIDDDMSRQIYSLLRRAEIVVAATPVFFYNATAQLKALIDRSQTLWARKYKLQLTDPGRNIRRGFILAVGATRGKNLFEGLHLTAKYFFDAVGAKYTGSLTYREIEHKGDMAKHPTVMADVRQAAENLLTPLLSRKVILFAGQKDSIRSQMACAFTQFLAGDKIEALSGGRAPAAKIDPQMVEVMQERKIDMAFRIPQTIEKAVSGIKPEIVVAMDQAAAGAPFPEAENEKWTLPEPAGEDLDAFRRVRDEIETKVKTLINRL